MKHHIGYPSIGQFHKTIENVKRWADYHKVPLPIIYFVGSVKAHGTNISVAGELQENGQLGEYWPQAREVLLDSAIDYGKFLPFYEQYAANFKAMMEFAVQLAEVTKDETHIVLYGEWMGPNIFSGTALGQLPNRFMLFGVRVVQASPTSNEPISSRWLSDAAVSRIALTGRTFDLEKGEAPIYCLHDVVQWKIVIDFANLTATEQQLAELTNEVAVSCPVAKFFGAEGVGEGIVWQPDPNYPCPLPERNVRFKTVGDKHTNKRRSGEPPSEFELAQMKKTREFAESLATEARFDVLRDRLKQRGIQIISPNIGEWLKMVSIDCYEEQEGRMDELELVWKEVAKQLASLAKSYWQEQVKGTS